MRAARRSTVAAVASRDPVRGELYAREWNIPVAHTGYDALLHDQTVDAVYIPLPNSMHIEWTLRALDAGKHVLCEKPLALVPEDVDRVAAVARARERVVAEAFMFRHEPLMARVVELLADDAIGPVRSISAGFTYPQSRSNDVRLDRSLGGGSLWDVGCYAVSAARLVAGDEPTEVVGLSHITASGVDDAFTGLLRFPRGVIAAAHSGFRAAYRTWLEVAGADGVLRVANPFKPAPCDTIEIQRGDQTRRIEVTGSALLFVRQIDDFIAAALDGRPATVSLGDSRGNAAALAALHRSAQSGRAVQL